MKNYQKVNVKPEGWLLEQLNIQIKGLSGNLDKVWPDVRDSAWIGGDREGWERLPYWLDGVIPLAYLLDDEDLKGRVKKYVDFIVDKQSPDGWICPCEIKDVKKYDVWALFLIGKVLTVYLEHEYSEKVHNALAKAMKWLYNNLKSGNIALFDWAETRWYECLIPLKYLYEIKKESWILELVKILKEQGTDYLSIKEKYIEPLNVWTLHTHVVNLAMMIKYEPLYKFFTGEKLNKEDKYLYEFISKYNGTPVGTFYGDECLAGLKNNRGTELCSVVELMYSFEVLFNLTGDFYWIDALEKVAFNALPATISDDMWTHQYDQQVNQIACRTVSGNAIFGTNNGEANLFGLEPNFGCCTANFSQGWPKFVENVCVKSNHELVFAMPLPYSASIKFDNAEVNVRVETEYPFNNTVKYFVSSSEPKKLKLKFRIPKADSATFNGEKVNGNVVTIEKEIYNEEIFTLDLEFSPKLINRPYNLKALTYGPLLFALPINTEYKMNEYVRSNVERKFPYCDYELIGDNDFNYGFSTCDFKVSYDKGDEYPFSSKNPRIKITADMQQVSWDFAEYYKCYSAYKPNSNKAISEVKKKTLIPYGSAKLRMTEMPMIKK